MHNIPTHVIACLTSLINIQNTQHMYVHIEVRTYIYTYISPVYTGILIQILIQTGCVYTEANWIQIRTQTTSPM